MLVWYAFDLCLCFEHNEVQGLSVHLLICPYAASAGFQSDLGKQLPGRCISMEFESQSPPVTRAA